MGSKTSIHMVALLLSLLILVLSLSSQVRVVEATRRKLANGRPIVWTPASRSCGVTERKSNYKMSNVSSSSTGPRGRGRVFGVPKRCWCGEDIVTLTLKSDANPCRRYYRCGVAAQHRLRNDEHTFKWVDEALLNEIDTLKGKNGELEQEVKEIKTQRLEFEKEIFEKVGDALSEAKGSTKKMMIVVVIGCMIMIGFNKLVG
ncbi:unnamed protein product [Arabidopsis halleri]